ncbi:MAG: tetratricopeptide repeat protein [Thermoanaerobaculia bacterium]
MTDGSFPDRLAQLKARWESDPSSRIFLQLAEEYRHQGRIQDALAVLDRGLQEHPGYLSALVAKGRCHLELGEADAARSVLERVVKQDPTQMVANKLLVRAYLGSGDPARARERLDLYSLLNDSDPEIGDLHRQIKLMDRPKEQVPEDSLFDLGPARQPRQAAGDVFSLEEPAPPPLPEPREEAVEQAVETVEDTDGDLFPGLFSRSSRERYLASLASEGIFEVGLTPMAPSEVPITAEPPGPTLLVPPIAMPEEPPLPAESDLAVTRFEPPGISEPEPAVEDASWLEEIAVVPEAMAPESPVFEDLAPLPPPLPAQEPAEDLWAEDDITPLPELPELPELEPEPAPVQPVATATLGEIYLRQGHADEAERIFREVLEREPGNGAAIAGLKRIEETRHVVPQAVPRAVALDAGSLLAGFQSGAGGTTARKVFLLNRYLDRIRGSRNVP